MNLASLSTLDANDPLPLALGPRVEPTPELQAAPCKLRVSNGKFVLEDPETGHLSCWPVESGAYKTHTDFPNRNPYFKRPPPEVEIALNAMETELNAARDKLQGVRTGRLETPAWQAWPPEPPAQEAKPAAPADAWLPQATFDEARYGSVARMLAKKSDGYVEIVRAD